MYFYFIIAFFLNFFVVNLAFIENVIKDWNGRLSSYTLDWGIFMASNLAYFPLKYSKYLHIFFQNAYLPQVIEAEIMHEPKQEA